MPRSADWTDQILNRYVQKLEDADAQNNFTVFFNYREQRRWRFSHFQDRPPAILDPRVDWPLADGSKRLLVADCAIYTNRVWIFFDAKEYGQESVTLDTRPLLFTNILAMPRFTETPKQFERERAFSAYFGLHSSRQPDIPLAIIFDYLRLHPDLAQPAHFWLFCGRPNPEFLEACSLFTKLQGRLAAPWTCLVVVFIAIPFGVATGRRNLFVGVAGSIFICFGYFIIQQVCLVLGAGGYMVGWLAAWLPNIIFGAAGLWLMTRVR